MTTEQVEARAVMVLVFRLVQRYELTPQEASVAVGQRRRGETGPHTHLVAEEATALMRDMAAPFRAFLEAMRPAAEAAAAAMSELSRALRAAIPQQPAGRPGRDRPAWASPYGPPPRRRSP